MKARHDKNTPGIAISLQYIIYFLLSHKGNLDNVVSASPKSDVVDLTTHEYDCQAGS